MRANAAPRTSCGQQRPPMMHQLRLVLACRTPHPSQRCGLCGLAPPRRPSRAAGPRPRAPRRGRDRRALAVRLPRRAADVPAAAAALASRPSGRGPRDGGCATVSHQNPPLSTRARKSAGGRRRGSARSPGRLLGVVLARILPHRADSGPVSADLAPVGVERALPSLRCGRSQTPQVCGPRRLEDNRTLVITVEGFGVR